MGQELSRAVFTPPVPPSYDEGLEGLVWVPSLLSSLAPPSPTPPDPSSPSPTSSSSSSTPTRNLHIKPIPATSLDWKGPNDETACFTLLYCNGGTSDLGQTLPWLKILRDTLHVNVVAFDYTGYGLHEGNPSEYACYDDARSVYAWLTSAKGVPAEKLIIFGKSIGTAVATDLISTFAAKSHKRVTLGHIGSRLITRGRTDKAGSLPDAALPSSSGTEFAGLILQSPFTSVLGLDPGHKFHVGVPDMFDSRRKWKRVTCPVLLAHGQNDAIVPKNHAKKIFKKLENVWKRFEVEGVGHHDVEASHDYLDMLVEYVEYLMPTGTTIKSEIVVPKFFTETPNQVVSNILSRTGMEQYTSLFLSQGYMDPFIISSLEEIDIMGMGIADPAHVKAVCEAVKELKSGSSVISTGSTTREKVDVTSAGKEVETNEKPLEERRTKRGTGNPPTLKQVEASLKPHIVKYADLSKERTLKSGFFEEVYRGKWKGQPVAVRAMQYKAHQYEQFCRHAATILSFKHPNLLIPSAICIEEPNFCHVSEWLDKGSLYDFLAIEGTSLAPLQRVQIALGVSEALLYLHSQSPSPFLHNDLTSRNVLLDQTLRPRVGNFGTLRPPSFQWMAPEVFSKKKYSTAADIHSLGIVLWEILTGYRPFDGTPPSIVALRVFKDGLRLPLPLINQKEPDSDILEEWLSLIRSCWHAEPARRPTAKSVVERLRVLLDAVSALSPPLSTFSFSASFAPYGHSSIHKAKESSAPVPSPLSAPASLGTQTSAKANPAGEAVSTAVQQMGVVLTDMQGLLHRVKDLQETLDQLPSSEDEDTSTSEEAGDSEGEPLVSSPLTSSADTISVNSKRPRSGVIHTRGI